MDAIYVRFAGDNDFGNTVQAFVKSIAPHILLGNWANITKEEVVALFNEHAYSLYVLNQCDRLKDIRDPKDLERTKAYLKIKEDEVYFGMEEFKAFTNWNHDGCLAYIGHDKIVYQIV